MRRLQRLFAAATRPDREDDRGAGARRISADPAQHSVLRVEERDRLIAAAAVHDAASRYAQSLALVGPALAATPGDPELLFARASTLFAWGRFREAQDSYRRMAELGLVHAGLFVQLGWAYLHAGNFGEAEVWMRKATVAEPASRAAQQGLAWVLSTNGRLDEAIAICEDLLKLQPDDFGCLLCLGESRVKHDDPTAGEAHFRSALGLDSEQAVAWNMLGVSLRQQDRHAEALEAFARAARIEGAEDTDGDGFVDVATDLRLEGRLPEALNVLEANLARRPAIAGYNGYAHALLASGRWTEGWNHYEIRWLMEPLRSVRYGSRGPAWAGQDLRGKTVMLRIEQGFGDCIQCLRYAPHVKALGATVLVGKSFALAGTFPGVDGVRDGEAPGDIDYYVNLLSLPRIFGTEPDSIPAEIPYLQAEPALAERWASRVAAAGTLKVGLVWAGNPGHALDWYRSLPLRTLAPLLGIEGVRFFSLQKGPAAAEADTAPAATAMVNLGPELDDFADTAAVISHLDLVLCVDTAVAHLAGALGKPVWLLLPQPADWRWLEDREDTPWYPTMRLFRQRRRGDWDDVVARVKAALERWVGGDAAELPPPVHSPVPAPAARVPVAGQWPPRGHRPGFCAVAETRVGILQYLPDDGDEGTGIGWYGEVLQRQLELLTRLVRPGTTVMEVAAGVGAHALPLAAAVGPAGHLLAYESRPVVRRILRQNLGVNRVANVTVMRRTLGPPGGSAGATDAATGGGSETVDELQLERLDWLKLNAGAAAVDVLAGAAETLWRLRPWLFIAGDERTLATLANRAKEFGYRCWRQESPLFNPANFNRRDDGLFAGRTALALLAIPEEVEADMTLDGCVEL